MFKKLFLSLFFVLFVCSTAFSAESVTATQGYPGGWTNNKIVTVSVQTATNGSVTAVSLNDITGMPTGTKNNFTGWYLYKIEYKYGATPPTADSDMYLYREASGVDVLEAKGVNFIDDNTNSVIYIGTSLNGSELLTISNNSVNTALFTLRFILYRW